MQIELLVIAEATLWQQIVEILTTPSLQLFLLLGSLLLAISLMLVTMTRLGHARPITKCVVLSVIAHILLLGYAYGTRLMFHVPVAEKEAPIQIRIDDSHGQQPEIQSPSSDESLNDFSTDEIAIETEPLARPDLQVPFDIERIVDIDSEDNETENSIEAVNLALLDRQQPQYKIDQPDIEFDESSDVVDPAPVPQTIDFQRHGEADGDLANHEPDFEPLQSDRAPADELREIDIAPTVMSNDLLVDSSERADQFASELEIPDSESVIADDFVTETHAPDERQLTAEAAAIPDSNEALQTSAPRRLADGLVVPKTYQLRALPNRASVAIARGGTADTEHAVNSALAWLAARQKDDGRWCPKETDAGHEDQVFGHDRGGCGIDAETGITSLATLAFLGAGHSHLEGPYQETIQKALQFIIRQQSSHGDLSGNARLFARMYCHSMSLLALSEALAISGDKRLEKPVRLGVNYSVQAQNKNDGGWRYQPGDSGDMSQFGWQVMALNAARQAGIEIQPATIDRMQRFLKSCQTGSFGGLASYRPRQGPSTSMTAEALVCRSFLNMPISDEALKEAQNRIVAERPSHDRINLYYWYYATLALQQRGGDSWEYWNGELQRVLLSQQIESGYNIGSWSPDGLWSGYGGKVYSTAMATLCLEVYYRYQQDQPVLFQATENIGDLQLDRIP